MTARRLLANAWTSVEAVDIKKFQSGDTLLIQGGDYSTEELDLFPGKRSGVLSLKSIPPPRSKLSSVRSICMAPTNAQWMVVLPGTDTKHYSTSIQMFKTVGLNSLQVHGKFKPANSVLIRQSTGTTVRGIECDQSAIKAYVDDGHMQQHGIAVNGHVYDLVVEYNYVHNTVGERTELYLQRARAFHVHQYRHPLQLCVSGG